MTSARQKGLQFEKRVREDLYKDGFNVSKFMNNVDLNYKTNTVMVDTSTMNPEQGIVGHALQPNRGKMIPAKQGRWRLTSTGFPDFICWRESKIKGWEGYYLMIGVECKSNGYLKQEEKLKLNWYLENNIFGRILIAKKGKKRGEIVYKNYEIVP